MVHCGLVENAPTFDVGCDDLNVTVVDLIQCRRYNSRDMWKEKEVDGVIGKSNPNSGGKRL